MQNNTTYILFIEAIPHSCVASDAATMAIPANANTHTTKAYNNRFMLTDQLGPN